MKKTSRRNFGKQVTHALVALPVASLATSALGQPRNKTKPRRDDNRSHENTPPPIELQDGSFSVLAKTRNPAHPFSESGSGPYTYRGKVHPTEGKNVIEHIRIVHGSGDTVYRDSVADGSVITIDLKDENDGLAGHLDVSCVDFGGHDYFQVVSTGAGAAANGQMSLSSKPGKPNHKHSLEHAGGPGRKEFRVAGIRVTKGGTTKFDVALPPVDPAHPFESQGFRVLIWLGD